MYIFKENTEDKTKGDDFMLKQIAWNTFKNTGNINTFVELMEVEKVEEFLKAEEYGNNKDKGDNNIRK